MTDLQNSSAVPLARAAASGDGAARRVLVMLISFLTLVDLFAAQAVLPALAASYHVSAATMGLAVNACTAGMAAAGLGVAVFGHHIPRRAGIFWCLTLLAVPTLLLAWQPPIGVFALLRVVQGLFMAGAFTLTVSIISDDMRAGTAAGALAAYVTGNVASNLAGRLLSAAVADHFGLAVNFLVLAGLNLAGAALVLLAFAAAPGMGSANAPRLQMRRSVAQLIGDRRLLASFAIGFLILFAFIGAFTYVNFVLVAPPLGLQQMQIGLVYFVFVPALLLTPFAGAFVSRAGLPALRSAFLAALIGMPLLVVPRLAAVLAGLALAGAGTFMAQAMATGFAGKLAGEDRGAASGLYLAAYYLGGLAGSAVLGHVFERWGWTACVAAIAAALTAAFALTFALDESSTGRSTNTGDVHA